MEFTWDLHVHDQILSAQPWSTGPWYFYFEVWLRQLPLVGLVTLGGWISWTVLAARGRAVRSLDSLLAVSGMVILLMLSVSETKKDLYLIPLAPYAAVLLARTSNLVRSRPIRNLAIAVGVLGLLLDFPALDPSGPVLTGAEPVLASSRAARDASAEDDTVYVVDHYFTATQYYSERRAVSVWTRQGPAELTGRIPYIRHGRNMIDVPLADLPKRMQSDRGVWIMPNTTADAIAGSAPIALDKLYRDAMLSVLRAADQ